jgi:hypothetical protein
MGQGLSSLVSQSPFAWAFVVGGVVVAVVAFGVVPSLLQPSSQGLRAGRDETTTTNGGSAAGSRGANGVAQGGEEDGAKFPAGPLHIYFGSQTGTAESFSKTVQKEGRAKGEVDPPGAPLRRLAPHD